MKRVSKISNRFALSALGVIGGFALRAITATAAPPDSFHLVNLVSDQAGAAQVTDANLVNPWGFVVGPEHMLVVAENHSDKATLFDAPHFSESASIDVTAPTDVGFNNSGKGFVIRDGRQGSSVLLFATEEGKISGWNPRVNLHSAVTAVDTSGVGGIYKSMALVGNERMPLLFAANFGTGNIEKYDSAFHLVKAFTDPALLSANFVPFGVRVIARRVLVSYAFKPGATDDDETPGPGLGYIVEFDTAGKLVRRFASQGTLNAPWGMAVAPGSFGKFGDSLIVGNFGDGTLNSFNLRTGQFLGQLTDANGAVIHIEGLWGIGSGPGQGKSLYFTAGPGDEDHGLLGLIVPDSRQGSGQ